MRSSLRKGSGAKTPQPRSNSARHGRVTKEDIRLACLRRWDGRARVTTDWFNLYQEPELCFPDGDLLIYLREPGQSSRGPSFKVHKARLKETGFDFLLEKCISRPPLHPGTKCLQSACYGCDIHPPPSELYVPAPINSDLDTTFDHHITTRNFFAWLYDIPLAGRALGRSLVTLKERVDYYRPDSHAQSNLAMISYADSQRYFDFRECVDHALAALLFAECQNVEDLWMDAFSHCVGMGHRGLSTSVEYWAISYETRVLISKAQEEMEARVNSVRQSVCDFFQTDLSGNFLGLSQPAREHFDRFRSWLHSYYIEQYGFWPPGGFEDLIVERNVYASLYSDFRSLYHHLVDPNSSMGMTDLLLSASGGICTTQNIQAYDARHQYESLSKTMPLIPQEPDLEAKTSKLQRRKSWNLIAKRRIDKDKKKALRVQAIIAASNRDWIVMECPLVRRYSEFESQTIMDDHEPISMIDGRKVRWILIYAVLQTLISIMQAPKQVRNADGVTYFLCCRPPARLPWQTNPPPKKEPTLQKRRSMIEPDTQYNHSNSSSNEAVHIKPTLSLSKQVKEKRRQSLPARVLSSSSRPSTSRSSSIKTLMRRRNSIEPPLPASPGLTKPAGFCEILVQGYGNGLNEVDTVHPDDDSDLQHAVEGDETPRAQTSAAVESNDYEPTLATSYHLQTTEKEPELTPASSTSVSRESSNASANSVWSKAQAPEHSEADSTPLPSLQTKSHLSMPDISKLMIARAANARMLDEQPLPDSLNHVVDEDGLMRTIHFNTETWDDFLVALE